MTSKAQPGEKVGAVEILPVALLLKGKPCVVVGAGKVAARKAGHLLEAGASVTVIGEEVSVGVNELHGRGDITLCVRKFRDDDVLGSALVFAATDDEDANMRVLEACRERHVLCGCVDYRWRDGDLISPAVFRSEGVTVSVSTGGLSCRRSQVVRDNLARHLSAAGTAGLMVLGTSHMQVGLPLLEKMSLAGKREQVGKVLRRVAGMHEFILVNTCNRLELWAVVDVSEDTEDLLKLILGMAELEKEQTYLHRGHAAFEHVSLLAAGMLSQNIGENHIVSQIKQAVAHAEKSGWSGAIIRDCMSEALHVSRQIRSATSGIVRAIDIEQVVLGFLNSELPSFKEKNGLIIGTGMLGARLVEELAGLEIRGRLFWCHHRRLPDLKAEWQERVVLVTEQELGRILAECSYVVSASGAKGHILRPAHAECFRAGTVVVDAGMPRNADPRLADMVPGLRLVNLDDLNGRSAGGTEEAIGIARQIAEEHHGSYDRILTKLQGWGQGK